jgi:hypothetical protein
MSSPNGGAMVVHDTKASGAKKPIKSSNKNQRPRRPQDEDGYDAEFNPDDNVSEVSDDEYDADSPEEPRFKYSTADLAHDSPRNTKCCMIAMCILCIIVAIAVSITMVKLQENSDEKNAPKDPTPAPTTVGATPVAGENKFLATSEFVEDRCSPSSFADDARVCQGACNGFDCCEPLLPQNVSCFMGNREGCLNYNRCHITNGRSDPPPNNLGDICSPSRIQSDRSECEQQCASKECCWSDETSCVVSDFYACIDYAICQNLRDDLKVPVPTDTLKDLCDTGQTGSVTQGDACGTACAPAECCWSESTADNCLQDNFFACLAYEPCKKLNLTAPGTVVSEPSDDLADLCTLRKVNDGGEAACASVCNPGACCQQGAADYCFPDDPLGCLQYDPCKLVA